MQPVFDRTRARKLGMVYGASAAGLLITAVCLHAFTTGSSANSTIGIFGPLSSAVAVSLVDYLRTRHAKLARFLERLGLMGSPLIVSLPLGVIALVTVVIKEGQVHVSNCVMLIYEFTLTQCFWYGQTSRDSAKTDKN